MNWKNRHVLLTGGSGFIGSALAHRLIQLGADVTLLIKDLNSRIVPDVIGECTLKFGDVTDSDFVRDAVSSSEAEIVYHLAANAIVRISAKDPMTTYGTNIMGTVSVLEACRNIGVARIVCASSDKAYGDHDILPYREEFSLQPMNTYDTSKACMDVISRSYEHNYDMPVVVTRCSNVYGPGDYNFSRIVPNTIRRVLDGKPPELYEDVEKMEREFIFIDDVIDAYLLLGDPELSIRGAFNIGGTGPAKIRDITSLICMSAGRPDLISKTIIKRRETGFKEIDRQHIDAGKLYKATGWKALTSIGQGLNTTVKWYEELS